MSKQEAPYADKFKTQRLLKEKLLACLRPYLPDLAVNSMTLICTTTERQVEQDGPIVPDEATSVFYDALPPIQSGTIKLYIPSSNLTAEMFDAFTDALKKTLHAEESQRFGYERAAPSLNTSFQSGSSTKKPEGYVEADVSVDQLYTALNLSTPSGNLFETELTQAMTAGNIPVSAKPLTK